MASWMVHLRITDHLLDRLDGLSETEFVVGNIAPDSGVPTGEVGVYVPGKMISHFQTRTADGEKRIREDLFAAQYLSPEQRAGYTARQRSFYLGYYAHLLADICWVEEVFWPAARAEWEEFQKNRSACILRWKEDWYDLDLLFLQQHPSLRAFEIYKQAEGFCNDYLDIFPKDAFDWRRRGIVEFYGQTATGLDREYPYLTREQMDAFVERTTDRIEEKLRLLL